MTTRPEVRVFGGVAAFDESGRQLPVPAGKPTAVLAVLALAAGRTVRAESLVDALWGDRPPASARALIHTYISALRRALATESAQALQVVSMPGGYRLDLADAQVDALAFLDLAANDDADEADLASGLTLWRGPALTGVEEPFGDGWRTRLEAAKVLVQERLWRARLPRDPAAVVPELRSAVLAEPLYEEAVLLLAQALHAVGRTDMALAELDRYRRRLAEELGLDPSARVAEVRASVIATPDAPAPLVVGSASGPADAATTPADSPSRPPPLMNRRSALAAAVVGAGSTIAIAWRLRSDTRKDQPSGPISRALIVVDVDRYDVGATVELPVDPAGVVVGGDVAWVSSERQRAVAVIDLAAGTVHRVIGLPQSPTSLAAVGAEAAVGLGFSGLVMRLSRERAGAPEAAIAGKQGRLSLAADGESLWVAIIDGSVSALGDTSAKMRVRGAPRRLVVDARRAWLLTFDSPQLVALDRNTGAATVSALRGEAVDLAADAGAAFAVTAVDNRLWRADPGTGRVVGTRVLPGSPVGVTAASGRVWVAMRSPSLLGVYAAATLEEVRTIELPGEPVDAAHASVGLVIALR